LLENRVRGFENGPKILERRLLSHSPSFMPCVAAMYLLFIVESKIISCCLDDQETVPPLMRNA